MKYKVLAVPTHEQRQNAATAKAFEAMLCKHAAQGWRLVPVVLNGWAVMECGEGDAQSSPESTPVLRARPLSELPQMES